MLTMVGVLCVASLKLQKCILRCQSSTHDNPISVTSPVEGRPDGHSLQVEQKPAAAELINHPRQGTWGTQGIWGLDDAGGWK